MLIEVAQIPPEGLDIDLPEGPLDLGDSAELWDGPATVTAQLHLERSGRGFLIQGAMVSQVALVCSRCLERFPFRGDERFDLYGVAAEAAQPREEVELGPGELDVTYVEEGRLDTDRLLRESILLNLPVQPLCREECQGLCPRCGANRNQGACGCEEPPGDPRLQILRTLR